MSTKKTIKLSDLITLMTNEYNDYYQLEKIYLAGINKKRPALIIEIYSSQYFLIIFGTNAFSHKVKGSKPVRKGRFHLAVESKDYHFNLASAYIFNKKLINKNYGSFIANLNDGIWYDNLPYKTMETMKFVDSNRYKLIINIIDAILAEDFKLADQLIDQQFTKPTKEDIAKRQVYRNKRREYLKQKKKS